MILPASSAAFRFIACSAAPAGGAIPVTHSIGLMDVR